ncbi:hypothetical protein DFH29DRAFT_970504, partial [Suillus ampliporus]
MNLEWCSWNSGEGVGSLFILVGGITAAHSQEFLLDKLTNKYGRGQRSEVQVTLRQKSDLLCVFVIPRKRYRTCLINT